MTMIPFPGGGKAAGNHPVPVSPAALQRSEPICCESCGFDLFQPTVMLRRISALANPTGQSLVVTLPVNACAMCGHVNADALPPGLVRPEFTPPDSDAAPATGEDFPLEP